MVITRLHILLFSIIIMTSGIYMGQVYQSRQHPIFKIPTVPAAPSMARPAVPTVPVATQVPEKASVSQSETAVSADAAGSVPVAASGAVSAAPAAASSEAVVDRDPQQRAILAVAVAGEYWRIAHEEKRDVAQGQATLRHAKQLLAAGEYDAAWRLAHQAVKELQTAPVRVVKPASAINATKTKKYYTVRRGDTLWGIAKMPQHYRRGALWVKIWRANEKKIPDFDYIYPQQVLYIPPRKAASGKSPAPSEL